MMGDSIRNPRSAIRKGFTLTELLVVIGIIVLVAIIAVPALRAMTGSRSTEAAHNQLAGLLGRARAEAIGLQEIRGIAFFPDAETGRVQAIMVRQAPFPTSSAGTQPDVYLDFVPDRDPVLLPDGVGLQMIDDCDIVAGADTPADEKDDRRGDDAYIGFNTETRNGVAVTYGGAILFDGYGRAVSKRYGYKCYLEDAGGVKFQSNLAKAFNMTISAGSLDLVPINQMPSLDAGSPVRSQFGFVVYDKEGFDNRDFTPGDPQLGGTPGYSDTGLDDGSSVTEAAEERWIDANAAPQLVNRNNGTLVKGL